MIRDQIFARPTSFIGLTLVGLLAVPGCDKLADAVEKGAEAVQKGAEAAGGAAGAAAGGPMTEDDKLSAKLDPYIDCINGVSSSIHRSAERYTSWVDAEAGVTGKERNIYGLYEVSDPAKCKEGITKSKAAEPSMADLEAAADAFSTAIDTVVPLVKDAHDYYDEDNYKDDAFAKGKELHPKLMAGFKAFDQADVALRALVKQHNEALHERELARVEKEQGRKLLFHTKNVMSQAKKLLVASQAEFETLDLEAITTAVTNYEKAVDECETYSKAHKKETGTVMMFSMFISAADDLKKQGKALMRRKRDDKPWTKKEIKALGPFAHTVEGHPVNISDKFNDLVSRSNSLSWTRYQPE